MNHDHEKISAKLGYASILAVLIFVVLPLFAINGKYSTISFVSIPFGIGLVFSLLVSLNKKPRNKRLFVLSLIPIGLSALALIIIAGEGAICLIVFGLILLIPYYVGIIIGSLIKNKIWLKYTTFCMTLCLIMVSATTISKYNQGFTVKNEMMIHAPARQVWNTISREFTFGKPDNFFLRNGVSYPHKMELMQEGLQKYLMCHYNNGAIKAPILEYIENKGFSFHFPDTIVTMKEKNFYNESRTMHIRDHFTINFGKFEIVAIDSQSCKLVALTNFKHRFEPEIYTNLWVSYFLEKIHVHVLSAIKTECEQSLTQPR